MCAATQTSTGAMRHPWRRGALEGTANVLSSIGCARAGRAFGDGNQLAFSNTSLNLCPSSVQLSAHVGLLLVSTSYRSQMLRF